MCDTYCTRKETLFLGVFFSFNIFNRVDHANGKKLHVYNYHLEKCGFIKFIEWIVSVADLLHHGRTRVYNDKYGLFCSEAGDLESWICKFRRTKSYPGLKTYQIHFLSYSFYTNIL